MLNLQNAKYFAQSATISITLKSEDAAGRWGGGEGVDALYA